MKFTVQQAGKRKKTLSVAAPPVPPTFYVTKSPKINIEKTIQ